MTKGKIFSGTEYKETNQHKFRKEKTKKMNLTLVCSNTRTHLGQKKEIDTKQPKLSVNDSHSNSYVLSSFLYTFVHYQLSNPTQHFTRSSNVQEQKQVCKSQHILKHFHHLLLFGPGGSFTILSKNCNILFRSLTKKVSACLEKKNHIRLIKKKKNQRRGITIHLVGGNRIKSAQYFGVI